MREGLHRLSGTALVWSGYAGAALVLRGLRASAIARAAPRSRWSLAGAAALPWYAYLEGHPFRIRYDVPLVVACAALAGAGIGLLWSRARAVVAAAVVAVALAQAHPLDRRRRWSSRRSATPRTWRDARAVTAYLGAHRDGRTIMMSMGSLGHYMQDLSAQGFDIHDFLHEGNGEIWRFAMLQPGGPWSAGSRSRRRAEGGDALYRGSAHPRFLEGFTRVAEGGGVALYRARSARRDLNASTSTLTPEAPLAIGRRVVRTLTGAHRTAALTALLAVRTGSAS